MGSQFSSTSGYGLVNAATAVANAIGQASFPDVPDVPGVSNWNLNAINAPESWSKGYKGQGVVIAVIDSGVDPIPVHLWENPGETRDNGIDDDQNGYIDDINGWNFGIGQNNNDIRSGTNNPNQDHGSHVAGIIANKITPIFSPDADQLMGVAPDAQIMPLRLGDTNATGNWVNADIESLPKAIRYAVDNGAQVINMSLGGEGYPELQSAIAYAADKNVVVVSASGNDGQISPKYPSAYATQYGVAVGATAIDNKVTTFSNGAGTNSDIKFVVAPGGQILSSVGSGGKVDYKSGTSMAAPHVAGVAALMLSANPNLTDDQIYQILTNTATPLNSNERVDVGEVTPTLVVPIVIPQAPKAPEAPTTLPIPNNPNPTSPVQEPSKRLIGSTEYTTNNSDFFDSSSTGGIVEEIFGLDGNDTIYDEVAIGSTVVNSTLYGNGGDDLISGGGQVFGGQGNDVLIDGMVLYGNLGNDSLVASNGDSIMQGGKGNDTLVGLLRDNYFFSGDLGRDSLVGSVGNDTFFLNSNSDIQDGFKHTSTNINEVDVITNFKVAERGGDKIALNGLTFTDLNFEAIKFNNSGNEVNAIAIKIPSIGEYLGVVILDPYSQDTLAKPENFIPVDQKGLMI